VNLSNLSSRYASVWRHRHHIMYCRHLVETRIRLRVNRMTENGAGVPVSTMCRKEQRRRSLGGSLTSSESVSSYQPVLGVRDAQSSPMQSSPNLSGCRDTSSGISTVLMTRWRVDGDRHVRFQLVKRRRHLLVPSAVFMVVRPGSRPTPASSSRPTRDGILFTAVTEKKQNRFRFAFDKWK